MTNTSDIPTLEGEFSSPMNSILLAFTVIGMVANLASLIVKLFLKFAMPATWKMSCLLLDVSHLILGVGLGLLLCFVRFGFNNLCKAAGFFLIFGVLDCLSIYLVSNVIMLFVQYPEKLTGYSHYAKWTLPAMLVPEKTLTFILSLTPFLPIHYFSNNHTPFTITCFPIRETDVQGSGYGAAVIFITWILLGVTVIICLVTTFRLWKSAGGRIHASSPNIWQTMMLSQGKTYQRFLLLEQLVWVVVLFITTAIIYTNTSRLIVPQWIAVIALSVTTLFHAALSNIVTVLWSTLCCRTKQQTKEPFQKLKKLELIKSDAPGKLRMKATWSLGRGMYKRGLLKVYGVDHLKAWAQEIVILGMMRKSQSASLLQCLWTNSGNPYFETMTLITGEIIPSESRLICFEMTNSGPLDEFLHQLDMPLPEPCQRTIIHDIAEGLSCLHQHNILHHRLTSSCVYLKGSVQCMVLRAALGDFESAQIYGSLQGGSSSSSTVSKKHFFLPDIRGFALVALEIISYVCQKRQEGQQPFRKTRSEVVISPNRGHKQIPGERETWKEKAHKSRSLDERALTADLSDTDMGFVGSLVSVKEVDPHPNVPENDHKMTWGQPVTCVKVTAASKHKIESLEYSHPAQHVTDVAQFQSGTGSSVSPRNQDKLTVVKPLHGFKAESRVYDNDYEEIGEITEEIQRNQMAIQQVRYPKKKDAENGGRLWSTYPEESHYSVPVEVTRPRFIDQTVKQALPKQTYPGVGVFHRSDPLRHSASSVSTLEDMQQDIPAEADDHVNRTLKDLWLKKEADKKERLLLSYNERMRKELKDVFTKKIRRGRGRGVTQEMVHELSRPMSARDTLDYQSETAVVPFSEDVPHVLSEQTRPNTAQPNMRQTLKSTKKRPAPPPPTRPATATTVTRPQTAGNGIKKTQARAKLKRALGQKQNPALMLNNERRGQGAASVEMKYAAVKRIPQIKEKFSDKNDFHSTPVTYPPVISKAPVGQFSSFSSNDSLGSSFYRHSPRKGDNSLTSGELTSLSSQADTAVPCPDTATVIERIPDENEGKVQVKNGKVIDSGFDSASITSDVSCEMSLVDVRSCSCPSRSYTTETCSTCQCSISPTAGMHTKPLYPRRNNTDSFSSYDSTDLDQKLERLRHGGDVLQTVDIIGPDEQYPMEVATKAARHVKSSRHHGRVVSKTLHTRKNEFGTASKRYKELRKKGVPMRVSVVSSASSQDVSDATDWESYMESTAEVIEEEDDVVNDDNDEEIFKTLDEHGVFEASDSDSSVCVNPTYNQKPVAIVHGTKRQRQKVNRTNSMILDEIIRELPGELTGVSSIEDETQSFLHHPEPIAKEQCEEQEVDMAIEIPYKPSAVVDAELVIDRLFTKRNTLKHKGSLQDVMDPILGFDETLIRELAGPAGSGLADQRSELRAQMMKGLNETHVRSCKELTSKVPLVSMSELFPASNGQFRVLRTKLEKVGNFGTIGKQLLDTVQLCWISDSPPSASELVSRLLDSVTETEL